MENIFGKKLISARKMAGLSLQKLADRIGNRVTKQALSKYEQGKMKPDSEVLILLSKALKVPIDFFFSEPAVTVNLVDPDFRKHISRINKTKQEAILEKAKNHLERYLELEKLIHTETEKQYFSYDQYIKTPDDAEKAAKALRKEWDLGYDPIPDVVAMLEDKGYKVLDIDSPEGFDGLAVKTNGEQVIVLNTLFDGEKVRKRFTALHELAHHALHFAGPSPKETEKLCHIFASAVLYPEEQVRQELQKHRFHFYENELILIKERWGISFSALYSRALHLKIINENVYRKLMIGYKKRGYHKNEPGTFPAREKPVRFERLIYQALAMDIISVNEAAYFRGMNVWEFRKKTQAAV